MTEQRRRFPHIVRFGASIRAGALLSRLRSERDKNAAAWLRNVLDQALAEEFGAEVLDPDRPLQPAEGEIEEAPEVAAELLDEPHAPTLPTHELEARGSQPALAGWRPSPLPNGGWGARHDAAELLPKELVGRRIGVTDKRRRSWTSEVLEVVEETAENVLVRDRSRYVGRRRPDGKA